MRFTVVKPTLYGRVLLASDSGEAVAKPLPLLAKGERVGVVRETIGLVAKPFYVAELAQDAKTRKRLESG